MRFSRPIFACDCAASINDHLSGLLVDCLKEPKALNNTSTELTVSIKSLRASLSAETKLQVRTAKWSIESKLGCGDSFVARLIRISKGTISAVRFAETPRGIRLIKQETAIHKELKPPLILEYCGSHPGMFGPNVIIVTEVAENGSLASHLPSA
jgi:hypothetical protein